MRFYERTLGGKLYMMTHGESPMAAQTPTGSADNNAAAEPDPAESPTPRGYC